MAITRRSRLTWALGLASIFCCAWWAFSSAVEELPHEPTPDAAERTGSAILESTSERDAFDVHAFSAAVLWNPLKPEKPDALQATPRVDEKPLRLQLIGITQEGGILHAALYDQDENRLLIVKHGDQIRGHRITDLATTYVKMSDGGNGRELRLKREKP